AKPMLSHAFTWQGDPMVTNAVVIISYGLWERRLAADHPVLGKEILLDGQKHTVLRVMPPGFQFLAKETGLWVPKAFSSQGLANRDSHYLTVVARLKPGVTLQQARADIAAVMRHINQDNPTHGFEF